MDCKKRDVMDYSEDYGSRREMSTPSEPSFLPNQPLSLSASLSLMQPLSTEVISRILKTQPSKKIETLKIFGGEIDNEFQFDIILESLLDFLISLNSIVVWKKNNFTLSELLNALQVVEGIIKDHPSINNVEKFSLSSLFWRNRESEKRRKFRVIPTWF